MPREAIHWTVLENTKSALAQAGRTEIVQLLEAHRAAAYLGAVAHDAPYYYKMGGEAFERVAELLHGIGGEDTLRPLVRAADCITKEEDEEKRKLFWAFLLGMLSHLATDVIFHPMVCFYSGDYYHAESSQRFDARRRHRLLEVYLDACVESKEQLWNGCSILKTKKSLRKDAVAIFEFLERAVVLSEDDDSKELVFGSAKNWNDGLAHMAYLQRLFVSTVGGWLARGILAMAGAKFAPLEALFALGRNNPGMLLTERLRYKNPVSGEEFEASVSELLERASAYCVEIFMRFEPYIIHNTSGIEESLADLNGPSLTYGVQGASAQDATYFSDTGLPLEGLAM